MVGTHHLVLRDLAYSERGRVLLDGYGIAIPAGGLQAIIAPDIRVCQVLAEIVAGFERPARGQIEIDGRDLGLRGPGRRGIMSVRSNLALFPRLTGFANIAFPLEQQRHAADEVRRRVEGLSDEVGLDKNSLNLLPGDMPAEERLRVALARALAAEPSVLLLERPLQSLSASARLGFLPELRRLLRQFRITTLLVTDDLAEGMIGADDISVVMNGRELQRGGPETIYKRPANATVARLAGACNLVPVKLEINDGQISIHAGLLQGGQATLPRERHATELAPGPALLMVRPEAVKLFLGIRRFDLLAEGVIADVMPHGNGAQIRVALDQFPRGMLADVPLPAPMPLEVGRRATLGWNRGDFHLLPPEPST
jgi:iron(III) transport system ATP-binding protein